MGAQRIAEFVEFLCKLDPGMRSRMRGATESELDELERLAGQRFCSSYRQFMLCFGKTGTDALSPFLTELSFSIEEAAEHYHELREFGSELPAGVVFLWRNDDVDFHLSQLEAPEGDPKVIQINLYEPEHLYYINDHMGTFEPMLFVEAFTSLRMEKFVHNSFVSFPEEPTDTAEWIRNCRKIAEELKFSCISQSIGLAAVFDRDDASIWAGRHNADSHSHIWVASDDDKGAKRIARIFADNMGGYMD